MATVPYTVPISDLRARQGEILRALADEQVVLTHHGRAAAVMVSPDRWNQLIRELEDLQDALDAVEARRDAEPAVSLDDYLARRK